MQRRKIIIIIDQLLLTPTEYISSYKLTIKYSNDRSPKMQFEMLFGPPYSHSSEFQFTETIIFYWPLWFYGFLVIFALILLSAGIFCFVCVRKYTNNFCLPCCCPHCALIQHQHQVKFGERVV